jgi:molybdopterin/thiamine biosynthesis adenylyltransferase/rhodanese-related sulfurtransferase
MRLLDSRRTQVLPMDSRRRPLEPDELVRYSRQIRLPSVGLAGQETLKSSSVLVVGAGGLGSPAAIYLAAAGVGRIGIADDDRVDVTNLHRQPLHDTSDVGREKAESAKARIAALNPFVRVEAIHDRVTSENALAIIEQYDVVIDATDNFATRYLLNDACVLAAKPLIYGSVDRFEGQASVFATKDGPCYRCLFPTPPDPGTVQSCADAGVLGVLPGLIGTIQATEALKWLLGLGESLAGTLLLVDALGPRFRTIEVERDPSCPACGTREIRALVDYEEFCARPAPAVAELTAVGTISPRELSTLLNNGEAITIIDVREPYEWSIGRIPTAQLMPLGSMPEAAQAIDRDSDIVVYCHHGVRSDLAAQDLIDVGFRYVRNLIGGIDRWSREVDPRVPRY